MGMTRRSIFWKQPLLNVLAKHPVCSLPPAPKVICAPCSVIVVAGMNTSPAKTRTPINTKPVAAPFWAAFNPNRFPWNARGELDLQDIQRVIKPDDIHFAKTRLLCLENTVGGKAVSQAYTEAATGLARSNGLLCHLDGARIFNAAEKLNLDLKEISQPFDSISICLSKGLGAPAGSVLVGDANFIQRARRWRKMLGGGMRQAGILAAAGLHALTHNVARLAEDHENARVLGAALSNIPGFSLAEPVETNMVFLAIEGATLPALTQHLADHGIKISGARWVLHKDVSSEDLQTLIKACEAFAAARG